MTAFAEIARKVRKPSRTVVIPAAHFADDWGNRPEGDICVGLRVLSERDLDGARHTAAQRVAQLYAGDDGQTIDRGAADEAYNSALISHAVARGLCDPNDAAKHHPLFPLAEDQVPFALTPFGIRALWDAMHRLGVETSNAIPPISDEDAAWLGRVLARGGVSVLSTSTRKLLAAVRECLPPDLAPADESE